MSHFLSITLSTPTEYIDLMEVVCAPDDWSDLQACDEVLDYQNLGSSTCVLVTMLDETGKETNDDPVTLSVATAVAVLPDFLVGLLRRHLEAQ